MRLTVLTFVLLPLAAHAQEATFPKPVDPVAQSQSCPVGMMWDKGAQACGIGSGGSSPIQSLPGHSNCGGAAREVMS